jgi:hypothetical protein
MPQTLSQPAGLTTFPFSPEANALASDAAPPQPGPHFGPLLFERWSFARTPMLLVLLLLIGESLSTMQMLWNLSYHGFAQGPSLAWYAVNAAVVALAIRLAFYSYQSRTILRFHRSGVIRLPKGPQSTPQALPYARIARIGFDALRVEPNGIYAHTDIKLTMEADPELSLPPFQYSGRIKEDRRAMPAGSIDIADELAPLHQRIAQANAESMLRRIRAGETVPWTGVYALSTRGLTVGTRVYPFDEIAEASVFHWCLFVRARHQHALAASIQTGRTNFQAGWIAFQALRAQHLSQLPAATAA